MMKQTVTLAVLCVYVFFSSFRPTEPFLTLYLTTYRNFTNSELSQQVYPIWTYSYLLVLIPVFILTDLLRYKIVIVIDCVCYITTWILLIWGKSIVVMQIMEFFYGCGTSMEVAYYAYIYAVLDNDNYKKAASWTKSASLSGKFLAYSSSQLVVSLGASYMLLNYVTLINFIVTLFIAITFPSVSWKNDKSLETLMPTTEDNGELEKSEQVVVVVYIKSYFEKFFTKFKQNYSVASVWKWSLWWSLATCGYLQIGNYVQNLWILHQNDQSDVYNGIVHGVNTLSGAVIVFMMQFVNVKFDVWGELIMASTSALECGLLVVMSLTSVLPLSYACYCVCRVLYQIVIVIAMYNLAKLVQLESYGLVFGFNTFVALLLQSLMTMIVVAKGGLALDITTQFLVYGGYYGATALLFFVIGIYSSVVRRSRHRNET